MIKVISFDIGGTLVEFDFNKSLTSKIYNLTKVDRFILRKAIQECFMTNSTTLEEASYKFCSIIRYDKVERIVGILENHKSSNKLFPNTEDTLKRVKNMGYKIITISNMYFWNKKTLESYGIGGYIDLEIYSYNVGCTKPNNNIFRYAEGKMCLNSDAFLHIGDSMNSDIRGAERAGWKSVYVKREEKDNNNMNLEVFSPDYIISDLKDIIDILGELKGGRYY